MKMTGKAIIKTLELYKEEIRKFGVISIGLFGSFVHGKDRRRSDLDFLVVFEESTFDNYMELKFYLEKIFRKRVDLVIENSLKPDLNYVKKEALYAKGI